MRMAFLSTSVWWSLQKVAYFADPAIVFFAPRTANQLTPPARGSGGGKPPVLNWCYNFTRR